MAMEFLILMLVFGCVFMVVLFALPQKTEMDIRERLTPLSAGKRKRGLFVKFLGFFAPINNLLAFKGMRRQIERNLFSAGSSMNVNEYLALTELLMLFTPLLAAFLFGVKLPVHWLILAVAFGFVLPSFWLRHKIAARQEAITKALPEVIDLLNLAVGAGLDFMIALGKVLERAQSNPLIEELREVYQETKVGKTKSEALKSMAKRINLPDVSSFVRTLVQAEKMGTSISDVLRIQSEQARMWRFQRGERQALKAPIKLLLPLVFFILPVVMIIVGGPILLQFLTSGPFTQ